MAPGVPAGRGKSKPDERHMDYALLPLLVSIGLTVAFVAVAEASWLSKALVVIWLAGSLACRYLFAGMGLVGMLLQVALSIVLFLYLTYQKARS